MTGPEEGAAVGMGQGLSGGAGPAGEAPACTWPGGELLLGSGRPLPGDVL